MTESQHYQSPLQLLKQLGLNPTDLTKSNLDLVKKRLLLELQISEKNTVEVGSKHFTKNDLLELFDQLAQIDNFDVHTLITENPSLQALLEDSTLPLNAMSTPVIKFTSEEQENRFRTLVSPYLAFALNKSCSKAIKELSFSSLLRAQYYFEFLSPFDFQSAFKKIDGFCDTFHAKVDALQDSNRKFSTHEHRFLNDRSFYLLITRLSEGFPMLIDTVVYSIINFTVHFERSRNLTFIIDTCLHAERLDSSDEFKALLTKNRRTFEARKYNVGRNISSRSRSQSGSGSNSGKVIWVAIALAIFVIKIAYFSSRSEVDYDFSDSPYYEQIMNRQNVNSGNLNGFSFENFQSKLAGSVVAESGLSYCFESSEGDPRKLISTLDRTTNDIDTIIRMMSLFNDTKYDAVILIDDGRELTVQTVNSRETIHFNTSTESSFFIYTGRDWNYEKSFRYNSSDNSINNYNINKYYTISLNGHFERLDLVNKLFVAKNFTIYDFPESLITLKSEDRKLKLYADDRWIQGTQVPMGIL